MIIAKGTIMDFDREPEGNEFMISDLDLFCRDIRIRMYDSCMTKLAKESRGKYVPILDSKVPVDPIYLDGLPKKVEQDLEKLMTIKEVQQECKLHLKPIEDTFLVSDETYNALLNGVYAFIIGKIMHRLCADGVLEMCADDGKIVYRKTVKGIGYYNFIKPPSEEKKK